MTQLLKKLPVAALLLMVALSLSSCVKDKLANSLEGEWDVTSFVSDGEELIDPDFITSMTMEYEDYDSEKQEGDCSWTIKYYDGSSFSLDGTYEVDQEDAELTITFDGDSETFDLEIDGDELEISNADGKLKAERD